MKKSVLQLETLTCPSCVAKIEKVLTKTKGVEDVTVGFNSSRVTVNYDESLVDPSDFETKITKLGFEVLSKE